MAMIELRAFSDALGMSFRVMAAIPQAAGEPPYPVLWLLHGSEDDCTGWFRHTNIERLATRRGLAVVAPDAQLSLYEDMVYGQRFFTHIADELPEMLPRLLPLSAAREDNFIAGLSMGGMGAIKIAMRRPGRYSAVACLSAGYTNHRFHEPIPGTPRANRYFLAFGEAGPRAVEEETLEQARAIARGARQGLRDTISYPPPRIFHACGEQDPFRRNADFTREFFEALPGNPFSYTYREYPGRHNWEFWNACVPEMLSFLMEQRA